MKEKYAQLKEFAEFVVKNSQTILATPQKESSEMVSYLISAYAQAKGVRSLDQLALYWGTWLNKILYHFPEHIGQPKSTEAIHSYLKFAFCLLKRNDLLEETRCVNADGSKGKAMVPFSAALDKMKVKDMNEYLTFVKEWVQNNIGDFESVMLDDA